MFFTLSGISFSADDNAYMRIKRRYDSGIGDGMFFSIKNGGGFSQNQRIPLKNAGTLVAELGDMQVIEYDIKSLVGDYWKGTVNSLRYDVIGGAGATDYIAFSNKHGIYKADINVASVPVIGKMPETVLSSFRTVQPIAYLKKYRGLTVTPKPENLYSVPFSHRWTVLNSRHAAIFSKDLR